LEAQKHLSIADQSKISQLEQKVEEQLVALELGLTDNSKLETDLSETKLLLDAETKKVAELIESGHNFADSRATALLASEQNKVKALEHSCEQLMTLLDLEKKHVVSLEEKQEELQEQADASAEELATTKKVLEKSQLKLDQHVFDMDKFEDMKKEVIRLTLAAQQRDILMAAMLHAIGDAKAIKEKTPIQSAEAYLSELESRVGLDLAGLNEDVIKDRETRQLVLYNVAARRRTLQNVLLPLVPIGGGLIALHHHDPTILRELSADLRSNIGEFSHTLGDLSSSLSANLSANIGQLASVLADSPSLREPVAQMVGMASRRINIRHV